MRFKDIIKEVMTSTKREPLRSEPKCESPVGVVRGKSRLYEYLQTPHFKFTQTITDPKQKINHE